VSGQQVAGAALVALLAALTGTWLRWHREAPKTTTATFGLAGLALGDVLGRLIASGLARLPWPAADSAQPATPGLRLWVSLLLAGILLAATAELMVKGMWPRRARPRHWHPWLALALPTVAIAVGAPLVGPVMSGLASAAGGLGTAVIRTATPGEPGTAAVTTSMPPGRGE
jgi:MFS family permease